MWKEHISFQFGRWVNQTGNPAIKNTPEKRLAWIEEQERNLIRAKESHEALLEQEQQDAEPQRTGAVAMEWQVEELRQELREEIANRIDGAVGQLVSKYEMHRRLDDLRNSIKHLRNRCMDLERRVASIDVFSQAHNPKLDPEGE